MTNKKNCLSMRSKKAKSIFNFIMHIKELKPDNFKSKPSDSYEKNTINVSENIIKLLESKRLKRFVSYLGIKVNNQFFSFKNYESYIGKTIYVEEATDGKLRAFSEQLTFLGELNPHQI